MLSIVPVQEEQEGTPVENLSIRLYSEDEFETIKNPYATYAEGELLAMRRCSMGVKN